MSDVVDLVTGLAWPVTVGILAWIYKPAILRLLDGPVSRFKAGPFEVEMERTREEVREALERASEGEGVDWISPTRHMPPPVATGPMSLELADLAKRAPRLAIEEAYTAVEAAFRDIFREEPGLDVDKVALPSLAKMAAERGMIGGSSASALEGLGVLRNLADQREIDEAEAIKYLTLADATIYGLRPRKPKTVESSGGE